MKVFNSLFDGKLIAGLVVSSPKKFRDETLF